MTDPPWYAPGHYQTILPRERRSTEPIWRLRKGTDAQTAELLPQPDGAVELQLARNDAWYYSRRHGTRAGALEEAAIVRRQLEADGWTAA